MMNIRLAALMCCAGLAATGCSAVNTVTVTDDKLAERAGFTLGVAADKITISDRRHEGVTVNFTAKTGGRSYQCYVTSVPGVLTGINTSDAVCSNAPKSAAAGKGTRCNALLKAAGRC